MTMTSIVLQMCYRPHTHTGQQQPDWVQLLELEGAKQMPSDHPPKVMVLYGSLRPCSYSRLLAFEFARILDALGADVRVYDPTGLPIKDAVPESHPKVQELRNLSLWSEAQVWVCPEQHGTITAVFKNQIDWIPLSLGSVRPTQGRVLAVAQVRQASACMTDWMVTGLACKTGKNACCWDKLIAFSEIKH